MLKKLLKKNQFSIEKESIRTNEKSISLTEPKLENKYITTDFGEAQIEFITNIHENELELINELEVLHNIVLNEYDELLWPNSVPPILKDAKISKNNFEYKNYLKDKYGFQKQFLSGIHYNFNYSEELLNYLNPGIDQLQFKNQTYFKVARNYLYYRFIIIYLFGASPNSLEDFPCVCETKPFSIRMSECGYHNKDKITIDYSNNENYVNSLINANSKLQSYKELYEQIRIKPKNQNDFYNSLKEEVTYLELRSIDLNPFSPIGININDLKFLNLFMNFLLFQEVPENYQELGDKNHFEVARFALSNPIIQLKQKINLKDFLKSFLDDLDDFQEKYELDGKECIEYQKHKINIENTYSYILKNQDFLEYNYQLSLNHKKYLKNIFGIKDEKLQLSTQLIIKETYKKGLNYEIISKEENFIKVYNDSKEEYIKEATMTSLDNYINVMKVKSKDVTKKILSDHVPKSYEFTSALDLFLKVNKGVVIKPNSTNFGIGITVFKNKPTFEQLKEALDLAYQYDEIIICEDYFEGKEYRFLVIDNQVIGVINRDAANVIGDGVNNINQLINLKNESILRGKNYNTPLNKIKIDQIVIDYLNDQNINLETILLKNQKIYLRNNSNISTGGDSIALKLDEKFNKIAIDVTKKIGLKIAGVDMLINKDDFIILEVNFNPAIHMHEYPLVGESQNPAHYVLKALGF